MELKTLTLKGFRRFGDETKVSLEGKLVALVGSNEAGKTSLLQAIAMHRAGGVIPTADQTYFSTNLPEITLSYFLSPEDALVGGLDRPTWFHVTKKTDGSMACRLDRYPDRDTSKRSLCAEAYSAARNALAETPEPPKLIRQWQAKLSDEIAALFDGRTDAYTAVELQQLGALKAEIESAPFAQHPAYTAIMNALSSTIATLVQFERQHDPESEAAQKLLPRQPRILEFTPAYRELELPYNIRLKASDDPKQRKNPSKPLDELMKLVQLDLEELIKVDGSKIPALRQGLLAAANERLKQAWKGKWSQSDAFLEFHMDGGRLDVFVVHEKGFDVLHRYNNFTDRSAGYRQFIALQIFALLNNLDGATLLIDELEQHLHYDAQADVVQMLTAEPRIGKVIYATHSAGCLPEDLASGVKLVRWRDDERRQSEVINRFWALDNSGGFAPLLMGMGAATMSFVPMRRALIGEGATEMLLLPKMLKEALGKNILGFQILHGLSNFNLSGIPVIDKTMAKVCFIADNDFGGENLKDALRKAGVEERYIFSIGQSNAVCTVEDLIASDVWLAAVNAVGGQCRAPIRIEGAPSRGRVDVLPEELFSRKIDIAYAVLDAAIRDPEVKILDMRYARHLRQLAESIEANFIETSLSN